MTEHGKIYWTQKGPPKGGKGRIFRANIDIPPGRDRRGPQRHRAPCSISLPEPIDLELDRARTALLDRPRRPAERQHRQPLSDRRGLRQGDAAEIVITHLMEGIGISLDVPHDRMFLTDLAGSIYSARLDGSDKRVLAQAEGNLSGIAYADIPAKEA